MSRRIIGICDYMYHNHDVSRAVGYVYTKNEGVHHFYIMEDDAAWMYFKASHSGELRPIDDGMVKLFREAGNEMIYMYIVKFGDNWKDITCQEAKFMFDDGSVEYVDGRDEPSLVEDISGLN